MKCATRDLSSSLQDNIVSPSDMLTSGLGGNLRLESHDIMARNDRVDFSHCSKMEFSFSVAKLFVFFFSCLT